MTYTEKTKSFDHQAKLFAETCDRESYALFWEMGCGKTKPTIDTAAHLWQEGEIDGLLVVAPNNVHRNWVEEELPIHLPDEVAERSRSLFLQASRSKTMRGKREVERLLKYTDGLAILAVNYETFTSKRGKDLVWDFLKPKKGRVLYVVDEGHKIKTPGAKRTRSIIASGKYANYRRDLTGTPVANRPFDVYSQVRFLDRDFWKQRHLPKFSVFKSHFGVWEKGFNGKTNRAFESLLAYQRLDELHDMIQTISHRLLKEDVLDLPPKSYSRITFSLSPEQKRAYNEFREHCILFLESGEEVTATQALVKLLRLQQIACGYVGTDEGNLVLLPGKNARLETLAALCEDIPHKAIIWVRFRKDADEICARLGAGAVRYDGAVPDGQRAANKEAFQRGDAQFFVGNPAAGGTGLTLHAARTVVYYSNSFNLTDRLQSEDRAHRIGQEHPVQYIDLIGEDTVDEHIVKRLVEKLDVASAVTGDKLREWI